MINSDISVQAIEWRSVPLCRRYLWALFEADPVSVSDGEVVRGHVARWALGVLANGKYEVLGVWLDPVSEAKRWREVFEDLALRGVEKIRFVASNEPAEVRDSARATYPGTTVLPSIEQLLRQSLAQVAPRHRGSGTSELGALLGAASAQDAQVTLASLAAGVWGTTYPSVVECWRAAVEQLKPFYDSTPRVRRVILEGDDAVQRLHRSLCLAVSRHGPFASRQAATEFIVGALDRAERSLVARGSVREACTPHRAGSANRASSRFRVEALGL